MVSKSDIEEKLTAAGIKVTDARLQTMLFMHQNQGHYSAEEIYNKLSEENHNIGLATIYRTLVQLEVSGLIIRHSFSNGIAVYELNDGCHGHAVCLLCGKIQEFDDAVIQESQKEIAKNLGFSNNRFSHTIYGECNNCNN